MAWTRNAVKLNVKVNYIGLHCYSSRKITPFAPNRLQLTHASQHEGGYMTKDMWGEDNMNYFLLFLESVTAPLSAWH